MSVNIFETQVEDGYDKPIDLSEVADLVRMFSCDPEFKYELGFYPSIDLLEKIVILSKNVIYTQKRYIAVSHIVSMCSPIAHSYLRDESVDPTDLTFLAKLLEVSSKYVFDTKIFDKATMSYKVTYLPISKALSFYERLEHSRTLVIMRKVVPGLPSSFLPHHSYKSGIFLAGSFKYAASLSQTFLENYHSPDLTLEEFWDGFALTLSAYIEGLIDFDIIAANSGLDDSVKALLDELQASTDARRSCDIICDILKRLADYVSGLSADSQPLASPVPVEAEGIDGDGDEDGEEAEAEAEQEGDEDLTTLYKTISHAYKPQDCNEDVIHQATWDEVRSTCSYMISPITLAVQRTLKDNHQVDYDRGHRSGAKIDGRSYIRSSMSGGSNYFKRISNKGEKTYAIYLLFDISGSMGAMKGDLPSFSAVFGRRDRTIAAQQSRLAVALCEALRSYPEISLGIGAYHSFLYPLKRCRDRLLSPSIKSVVIDRLLSPAGDNNDIEALVMATKDTLSVHADKRLVIVMGDGEFCVSPEGYKNAWRHSNKLGVIVNVVCTGEDSDYEQCLNFVPNEFVDTHAYHCSDDKLGNIIGKICSSWMKQ